jgi:transposase
VAPDVDALQALRGIDMVVAVNFVVEIGDIRRFISPGQLIGYLGLAPTERSTGETVRRGSITKMGNPCVRQLLVESGWTYRFPPRIGAKKHKTLDRVPGPPKIREIAWKLQSRFSSRFRAFSMRRQEGVMREGVPKRTSSELRL